VQTAYGTARIAISQQMLKIGGASYSLANIARIRIVNLPKPPRNGRGNLKVTLGSGIGVAIVGFILAAVIGHGFGNVVAWLGILAAVATAVYAYRATRVRYHVKYALMLETTGDPKVGLLAADREALEEAKAHIEDAIDRPLDAEKVYTIGNVILGDQYNQLGDFNIGKSETNW
jgi:Family of unknown function (DUF6232)